MQKSFRLLSKMKLENSDFIQNGTKPTSNVGTGESIYLSLFLFPMFGGHCVFLNALKRRMNWQKARF